MHYNQHYIIQSSFKCLPLYDGGIYAVLQLVQDGEQARSVLALYARPVDPHDQRAVSSDAEARCVHGGGVLDNDIPQAWIGGVEFRVLEDVLKAARPFAGQGGMVV